jgi:hypothetical protein
MVSIADDEAAGGDVTQATRYPAALNGTTFVDVPGDRGTSETVRLTSGYALELDGTAGAGVDATGDTTLAEDDTWTLCQWGAVNSTATGEELVLASAGGDAILGYNGSASEWYGYVYDDGLAASQSLTTSATTPTDYTHVCLARNDTDLTLYLNATATDSATIQADDTAAEDPHDGEPWHGTVEETRMWDDNLTSAEVSTVYTNPVGVGPTQNRSARVYYDAGTGDVAYLWFQPVDLTVSGGTWVQSAFGAQTVAGTGYEWRDEPPQLRATSGSSIEDAPVAWVNYEKTVKAQIVANAADGISDAFSLAGLLTVVIVAAVIAARVRDL